MNKNNRILHLGNILRTNPTAWAVVRGSESYPDIFGNVRFFDNIYGTLVVAELHGLPRYTSPCESPIFAFHIHEGGSCHGDATDPFASSRMHYNPYNCPHPYHAGDLPPLFSANSHAFSTFLTDRFTANEVVGKTVIIHSSPDDFSTQPSGNSGTKIACGEIVGRKRVH